MNKSKMLLNVSMAVMIVYVSAEFAHIPNEFVLLHTFELCSLGHTTRLFQGLAYPVGTH